jgi:hypothetical protein
MPTKQHRQREWEVPLGPACLPFFPALQHFGVTFHLVNPVQRSTQPLSQALLWRGAEFLSGSH